MFETMRKVFGPTVVMIIIGAIALVFVFYGVFSPKTAGMRGGGGVAAKVNGEPISLLDFEREYKAQMDYYEQMFKGKTDPEMLKRLGIRKQILDSLISRKLITQQAAVLGFQISDQEVREKIQEMPYFKKEKENTFSPEQYKQVLAANNRTPSDFEQVIREDLQRAKVSEYMQSLAKVTEKEVEQEFQIQETKRQVDYIMIDRDAVRKNYKIADKEIDDFLAKKENLEQAKKYYEQAKFEYMKPHAKKEVKKDPKKKDLKPEPPQKPEYYTFEEVKRRVVTDQLKDRKTQEITKMTKDLADEIEKKSKTSALDEIKSFAKSKGLEIKSSDKFNRTQSVLGALGSLPEMVNDVFTDNSTLVKAPKMYQSGVNHILVFSPKSFAPDDKEFAKQKETLEKSISSRKSQEFFQTWLKELESKAKIVKNEALANEPGAPDAGAED